MGWIMSEIQLFDRDVALKIAEEVNNRITPFCHDSIIVGGLRRQKDKVHDIDIIALPKDPFNLSVELGNSYKHVLSHKSKFSFKIDGIEVEIWIAVSERQFEVLKLIRTGSHQFNMNLCSSANDKSMSLRYSHKDGLCGLYGAVKGWEMDDNLGRRRPKMFINPMRRVAWRENDIIMAVLNDESYLDPKNRNLGYEEDYENEL